MKTSRTIKKCRRLSGTIRLPGDKSISHRVAMLASVAEGTSTIANYATSADCLSTLDCLRRLGIEIQENERLTIHGRGLRGFTASESPLRLDCGNSGSTIRMLSGLLAGQSFHSSLDGDESLRRRPLRRVMEPLSLMGARLRARDGNFPPLEIEGAPLRAIEYASPIASAQVKTCVLFAGLLAEGATVFREPLPSRDHTERMLPEFGARLRIEGQGTAPSFHIEGGAPLSPVDYEVPGDPSSAAFFAAAAAMIPDSSLTIRGACLNPSRTAFLSVLRELGARISESELRIAHGEPVGNLRIEHGGLKTGARGMRIDGPVIPALIDEIPILAVVATQVEGRIEVRDARELRVKESDRIRAVAEAIRAMGGEIDEFEDGFAIEGPQSLRGAKIESYGDHRIAMSFAIAGLVAAGETEILGADCAAVSFPDFFERLAEVAITE